MRLSYWSTSLFTLKQWLCFAAIGYFSLDVKGADWCSACFYRNHVLQLRRASSSVGFFWHFCAIKHQIWQSRSFEGMGLAGILLVPVPLISPVPSWFLLTARLANASLAALLAVSIGLPLKFRWEMGKIITVMLTCWVHVWKLLHTLICRFTVEVIESEATGGFGVSLHLEWRINMEDSSRLERLVYSQFECVFTSPRFSTTTQ